ncbi:MAG: nucleotidyltransferase domain-containing protein, partial [Desulfobulbus sp.]|nr:nucleotidyltransferase domain-containing protein [Desulfobulbus sp.]
MTGTLRTRQQELAEQWRQGLDGRELLHRHAALADAFIVEQFDRAQAAGEIPGQVAMVALGGYGRGELYPYSDIDLLLLHDQRAGEALQAAARALLYPLWDAGYEVGHSVRTVKEAVRFAREDFPFQVALLDARLVAGAAPLLEELRERYTTTILQGRRQQFVRAMEGWRAERRRRYGSHSFLLEPHIKEGTGGLRDIQAMHWVARGVFSLPDLEAVQGSGMLADTDRQAFERARSMLTRIRYGLHQQCRRKSDHLVLDYQEDLAAALGYEDSDGQRGVERFMREVYTHLQTVAVVTDLFFEHVLEILGMTGAASGERRLERAIAVRGGTVRLTAPEELGQRPYLLMRLFLQAGRTGLPLHHRTRQAVTAHLHLVDDGFRESRRVARIFCELLTASNEVFPVLEAMLATGLLTRYLPEFAAVESLAQH